MTMKRNENLTRYLLEFVAATFICLLLCATFFIIGQIQSTAKVINYTGIIRGATQRLIKLELGDSPNDDLMDYLNDIWDGLQYGGGVYSLSQLNDSTYEHDLNSLHSMWENLQEKVATYRSDPNTQKDLLQYSERYFQLANTVVEDAENYSNMLTNRMRILEILISSILISVLCCLIHQMLHEIHFDHQTEQLRNAAYTDKLTGIANRRSIEERIWSSHDLKTKDRCVIMFDLNNLKTTNDTFGHQAGDRLICSFAVILQQFSNTDVFVGRYGGDEFIMILQNHSLDSVKQLLMRIRELSDSYQDSELKIDYAHGYAYGKEYLSKLTELADERMYQNKRELKEARHVQ